MLPLPNISTVKIRAGVENKRPMISVCMTILGALKMGKVF